MTTAFHAAEDGTLPGNPKEQLELLEYWNSYSLDQYYDSITRWTFSTKFVSFSRNEAIIWLNHIKKKTLNEEEERIFSGMLERLQAAIQSFGSQGAFVKLSTRSPKDAVDKIGDKVVNILRKELESIPDKKDQNDVLIAIRKSFFKAMKVHSSKEAMEIMILSARTISDLKMSIDLMPSEKFNLQFVVREFFDIHPKIRICF